MSQEQLDSLLRAYGELMADRSAQAARADRAERRERELREYADEAAGLHEHTAAYLGVLEPTWLPENHESRIKAREMIAKHETRAAEIREALAATDSAEPRAGQPPQTVTPTADHRWPGGAAANPRMCWKCGDYREYHPSDDQPPKTEGV